jgi:hypothetical protein
MQEEIAKGLEGFKVEDIFTIDFNEEDPEGSLFQIGFTDLGSKAIDDLMKRYPQITEQHIEVYVKSIASRLLVFLSEKIKQDEKDKDKKTKSSVSKN